MTAPFRIVDGTERADDPGEAFRQYLERLLKMIPGEVVAMFLIGKGFIPPTNKIGGGVWFGICLIFVILIRTYGTAAPEPPQPKKPQWAVVIISTLAYVIWVYSLGWPF